MPPCARSRSCSSRWSRSPSAAPGSPQARRPRPARPRRQRAPHRLPPRRPRPLLPPPPRRVRPITSPPRRAISPSPPWSTRRSSSSGTARPSTSIPSPPPSPIPRSEGRPRLPHRHPPGPPRSGRPRPAAQARDARHRPAGRRRQDEGRHRHEERRHAPGGRGRGHGRPHVQREARPRPGKLYHDKGRGNGYELDFGGTRVYLSGDTECTPEMKALEKIDVAFVCMNLPYTMPPGGGGRVHRRVQAEGPLPVPLPRLGPRGARPRPRGQGRRDPQARLVPACAVENPRGLDRKIRKSGGGNGQSSALPDLPNLFVPISPWSPSYRAMASRPNARPRA